MLLPRLPPDALQWSYAASTAAAISYADRGTSAIAASSLLNELHWSESQLGNVQSSFFIGYGLTQIIGGILGGEDGRPNNSDGATKSGGYRTVLPTSLLLTGIITMLFPLAASYGVLWASADRFCLGLLEGLLLPAAMAGISDTTTKVLEANISKNDNIKATASSLVIAGCYLGSAWAYFSAWILYSEQFQQVAKSWGYNGTMWPLVFYVNGIISIAILYLFRDEFNIQLENIFFESSSTESIMRKANNIWEDTLSIANETISSKSGRAILSAQVGQGALLYSISSYSPLYLERMMPTQSTATNMMESSAAAVTAAASIAASSLILPQITQALVGVSIGAAADNLSSNNGTRTTRRSLQLISGVVPALILWYLSTSGDNSNLELSPALLFGIAQTVSAFSLGAVSVSQLDICETDKAGSVYALGNVAAAVSGSLMVSIFGQLLDNASSAGMSNDNEFSLPFQLVALLSATGSVIYAFTVETELEIGSNQTDQSVHPQL